MINSLLRSRSRSHTIGGVTYFFMPYMTLRSTAASTEFAHIVPEQRQEIVHRTFTLTEGDLIDVEFGDDLQPHEAALRDYWMSRSPDMAERWLLFSALCTAENLNNIWEAYSATREKSFEGAPTDPEAVAASATS